MSDKWQTQEFSADDPLSSHRGRPIISAGGPNQKYVGRVIIEFWESDSARDDTNKIAYSADAVDGDHPALLRRVAAALAARVQK